MWYRMAFMLFVVSTLTSCSDDDGTSSTNIEFSMSFDESLPRLGNFGEAVSIPVGHAAQHPAMEEVSIHYIEFAPNALTPLTAGAIVYQGEETTQGGARAVDFENAIVSGPDEVFLTVDLSTIPPGTYEWVRVSLTYQKYDIAYRLSVPPLIQNQDFTGRLASFVGFNTFIQSHELRDSSITVNANKLQGYWALETSIEVGGFSFGQVHQGDGAGVTVVNPINSTSPVPAGSCVVTGQFSEPLVITGTENSNKRIDLSFSINNSFEWIDINPDGKFEPAVGETVVDMGLRGLHPRIIN